jgi:O-antigen ligase
VNRNSFATYAGLGLIATTALTLQVYRHSAPNMEGVASYRLTKFIAATGRRGAVYLGAGLVILVALLATVSRGGIVSSAVGLFVVIALTSIRQRRMRGDRLEAVALVTAAIGVTFVAFGDRFLGRIASGLGEDVTRWSVDAIALRAILDAPLLGLGYGTFADVFQLYRDKSISNAVVFDLAHNTYIETWVGLGLVFGTALMAAIGLLVVKCLVGAVRRKRDSIAPVVATAAAVTVGLHALVDFSLQMQAVSLTFMALLGAGVAQAESSRLALAD